jgi:hypothetical protein
MVSDLEQFNNVSDTELHITGSTHEGWVGRHKIDVCETDVANPKAGHHNLIMADRVTREPPWEYHWFHIMQLVALGMIPVLLLFGQDTLMESSLKVKTEDIR